METCREVTVSVDNGPEVPGVLMIDRQAVDVTTIRKVKPDPRWTYVDAAGHWHAYDKGGGLPTLRSETQHVECDNADHGVCDGYERTVHRCVVCGEAVTPGKVTAYSDGYELIPGSEIWRVDVGRRVVGDPVSGRARGAGGRGFLGGAEGGRGRSFPAQTGDPGLRV